MRSYCKYYSLLALFILFGVGFVSAQSISVSAPSRVSAGENFRLSYTINTDDVDDFRVGNIPNGLEVIAGPYTSQQSSYQMVNGHTSSSSSITFTYTLFANKNGTYTIPEAHAVVKGKRVNSRAVKIVVAGHAQTNGGAPGMHNDAGSPRVRDAGSTISGNDLFIKVSANKKRVHEQEPILLTYKVYTLVELTQLEGKMPDLTGFHTQEIKLPQQKSFHVETVNGRPYRCVTWSQYVMYPQMTGKLKIPSITFKGIVVQQNRNVNPFEAFFNGGSGYIEVKRNIEAPGMTIQVDPLPGRPANFSGGVGKFNISASLNKTEVKAGEPLQLRVVVGGAGNLKLIKQPTIAFPKDFDKYDPKVTDKTKLTANGLEGNMVYDYLAVPQNQGRYVIPPVALVYYDTSANSYRTVKTQSFTINVAPGDGKTDRVADFMTNKDNDIRGIHQTDMSQHALNDFFFGSVGYILANVLPFVAFVILLIVFRRRAIDNADMVKLRGRKASKMATRRLRKANRLMLEGRQNEFYDEVLHALWGYMGDKLNMPVEQLSRDNITETLAKHAVDTETIELFVTAIDECEFERYAPGDAAGNMNRTFESAMTAIMRIEEVMKRRRKTSRAAVVRLFLFLSLLSVGMPGWALTRQNADAEYKKGNYQQAIKDYETLLKSGVSSELYYNLGNAYYRTDNITKAVLNYERALMLNPADRDIRFNLQFARSKTIDKIVPADEMFFVTWYKAVVNSASVDRWASIAVFSICAVLVLLLVYLFGSRAVFRKVGFFGACFFFMLFLLGNLFAWQQKSQYDNRTGAIVVSSSVSVKATPGKSASEAFILHEGTRVEVVDKTLPGWRAVQTGDGRSGWVPVGTLEEI